MNPNSSLVNLTVSDGGVMQCYVAEPTIARRGGLLVLQEAFGVNAYLRSVADRFAAEGYLVIAPELFHRTAPAGTEFGYTDYEILRPNLAALTTEGLEADMKAAHAWLVAQGIAVETISSIGFCMGGRASFLANTVLPLHRAISFYGGNMQTLIDRAASLSGPMLLFWGGLDKHIGTEQPKQVMEAMDAAGKAYTNVVISDADHGFFCDARPSYNARAAALAWPLVLEFLK